MRPEVAEAFYAAHEALQTAEVDIFVTLHKCFELRVKAHPQFRDLNFDNITTPESYVEQMDRLYQQAIYNPDYPRTPQDFTAIHAEQSVCMRNLVDAIDHWAEALKKFNDSFEAWAGFGFDNRAGLGLLQTDPIEFDFLTLDDPSPAIGLWISVRLRLMSDRHRTATPGEPPTH